jgi:uncharacterized protein involved in exopolysaccharide biosynthesis
MARREVHPPSAQGRLKRWQRLLLGAFALVVGYAALAGLTWWLLTR